MSDLFGNHIVGFPTRRLILLWTLASEYLIFYEMTVELHIFHFKLCLVIIGLPYLIKAFKSAQFLQLQGNLEYSLVIFSIK